MGSLEKLEFILETWFCRVPLNVCDSGSRFETDIHVLVG